MRHAIVLLVLIGCIGYPTTGSAQPLTVDWGVKAGVNSADIQSSTVGGERRRAFVGGGFLELDFVGSFALQADLLYSQKGDENEVGSGTDRTLFEVKLDYVKAPIMLKLQGPLLGRTQFLLDLRFTPGFSTIRDDAVIQTERASYEIPDPEATNSTFSVMAGIAL